MYQQHMYDVLAGNHTGYSTSKSYRVCPDAQTRRGEKDNDTRPHAPPPGPLLPHPCPLTPPVRPSLVCSVAPPVRRLAVAPRLTETCRVSGVVVVCSWLLAGMQRLLWSGPWDIKYSVIPRPSFFEALPYD